MYGGIRGGTSLALVLGLGLFVGTAPVQAADLGGDCCTDLEERVAELEATTARKGNRKVSLELSGHVNEAVLWWDDGAESNANFVTNDNARTRFRFKGKAKISKDLEAGYQIEIGIRTANSKRFTQNNSKGAATTDYGMDVRDSYWFLKSKTYGKGSLGLQASATDQITEINQTQTASFAKYSDVEDTGLGLLLRSSNNGRLSGLSWRRLIGDGGDQPGEGERRFNVAKYESPEFAGFVASASWGEDDFWDVALNYSGEFAGFKIAAGIGYGEIIDNLQTNTVCAGTNAVGGHDASCTQFGGSFSVIHQQSGLFVNFGAGQKVDDLIQDTAVFQGTGVDDSQKFWAVQAGIEKKFTEYGKTTIYGEYYDYTGGGNNRRAVASTDALHPTGAGADWSIWGTGVEVFGAGLAQGFDKASMVVYLSYRHVEGDVTLRQQVGGRATGGIADAPIEDLDLVMSGAIIKF